MKIHNWNAFRHTMKNYKKWLLWLMISVSMALNWCSKVNSDDVAVPTNRSKASCNDITCVLMLHPKYLVVQRINNSLLDAYIYPDITINGSVPDKICYKVDDICHISYSWWLPFGNNESLVWAWDATFDTFRYDYLTLNDSVFMKPWDNITMKISAQQKSGSYCQNQGNQAIIPD